MTMCGNLWWLRNKMQRHSVQTDIWAWDWSGEQDWVTLSVSFLFDHFLLPVCSSTALKYFAQLQKGFYQSGPTVPVWLEITTMTEELYSNIVTIVVITLNVQAQFFCFNRLCKEKVIQSCLSADVIHFWSTLSVIWPLPTIQFVQNNSKQSGVLFFIITLIVLLFCATL